jgi:hypothetical protein
MKKTLSLRASVGALLLLCASTLLYSAFAPLSEGYVTRQLQQGALQLQVEPLQQKKTTSCGEAVITMVYNYLYPETPLDELDVIQYAAENGYYTPGKVPFTSPANMIHIARHYTADVDSGNITIQEQGLVHLLRKLQANEPIIIDVFTRLNDPDSGAHFIVVTGISADPTKKDGFIIHYNNPQTGRAESAEWDLLWYAWQNNPDPGGAGWWMTFPSLER